MVTGGAGFIGANFMHDWLPASDGPVVNVDYPEYDRIVFWNDPDVGVRWPLDAAPVLAAKDAQGKRLRDAELFA